MTVKTERETFIVAGVAIATTLSFGYKLKYCEFEFFFNKNLKCSYISIKDQIDMFL